MSNTDQKSLLCKGQSQDLAKNNEESCNGRGCLCLDCKHICICSNNMPSLSKSEENIGGTLCRSYECFKNQYATCKLRKGGEENQKTS